MDISKLPKTRAEAKATGATHYFTGEPCKHGHVAPRKTKGACIECVKNEWKVSNKKRAVPGVGEVPGVGALFSATYDRDARKELVIFLTPHII